MSVKTLDLPIFINALVLVLDILCMIAAMTELLCKVEHKRKKDPLLETYLGEKKSHRWQNVRLGLVIAACIALNLIVFQLL